jgi:hypothetical protein
MVLLLMVLLLLLLVACYWSTMAYCAELGRAEMSIQRELMLLAPLPQAPATNKT